MKRKISLSVTAFAWIFIAGAVLSLLSLAVSRGVSLQWRQVVVRPFWIAQIGLSFILAAGKAGSGGFSAGQYLISYIVAVTPAIIFFSVSIYIFNLPDVKKQFIRK